MEGLIFISGFRLPSNPSKVSIDEAVVEADRGIPVQWTRGCRTPGYTDERDWTTGSSIRRIASRSRRSRQITDMWTHQSCNKGNRKGILPDIHRVNVWKRQSRESSVSSSVEDSISLFASLCLINLMCTFRTPCHVSHQ